MESKDLFSIDKEEAKKYLNSNKVLAQKYFDAMLNDFTNKNYEEAAKNARNYAYEASERHLGIYASRQIENILQVCAKNLPDIEVYDRIFTPSSKRKVLHVISEGYYTGGHTKIIEKWIKNDPDSVHSLVINWPIGSTPNWLLDKVEYVTLENFSRLETEKAMALRKIAYQWADVVILHVHMFDPIPVMAFGIDGGPPVVYMNHGDHVFWLGSSIADLVLDMRPSGQAITLKRRGAKKSYIFPIPLEKKNDFNRDEVRKKYGLDKDTTVILTMSNGYKYRSFNDNKFEYMLKEIVEKLKNVVVYVVGPRKIGIWEEVSNLTGGKIRVMGVQPYPHEFYQIADIYMNSFMIGGMTSVLDAALYGIPIIKYNSINFPTIRDFGEYLDKCNYDSLEEIIEEIRKYSIIKDYNLEKTKSIKEEVSKRHIENTNKYINEIYNKVSIHKVNKAINIDNTIEDEDLFWAIIRRI
ncbi:hypothetical protein [Clostridium sp.]|uniref:hypothetical protein n=1 Tax=Clostridium sp. TaxID=1506 RepID=UPI003F3BA99A